MAGYKTKIGCIITFLGGVVAILTGAIAEVFDIHINDIYIVLDS